MGPADLGSVASDLVTGTEAAAEQTDARDACRQTESRSKTPGTVGTLSYGTRAANTLLFTSHVKMSRAETNRFGAQSNTRGDACRHSVPTMTLGTAYALLVAAVLAGRGESHLNPVVSVHNGACWWCPH